MPAKNGTRGRSPVPAQSGQERPIIIEVDRPSTNRSWRVELNPDASPDGGPSGMLSSILGARGKVRQEAHNGVAKRPDVLDVRQVSHAGELDVPGPVDQVGKLPGDS